MDTPSRAPVSSFTGCSCSLQSQRCAAFIYSPCVLRRRTDTDDKFTFFFRAASSPTTASANIKRSYNINARSRYQRQFATRASATSLIPRAHRALNANPMPLCFICRKNKFCVTDSAALHTHQRQPGAVGTHARPHGHRAPRADTN